MTYINTKKYKIVWSSEFLIELDAVYNYLIYILKEPELAKKLHTKISKVLSSLQVFTNRHLNLNNFIKTKNQNLHRILIGKYVIIYRINYDIHEVYILHIFYTTQDYFNLL